MVISQHTRTHTPAYTFTISSCKVVLMISPLNKFWPLSHALALPFPLSLSHSLFYVSAHELKQCKVSHRYKHTHTHACILASLCFPALKKLFNVLSHCLMHFTPVTQHNMCWQSVSIPEDTHTQRNPEAHMCVRRLFSVCFGLKDIGFFLLWSTSFGLYNNVITTLPSIA